ncbi:MAG TPA: hypothetical protein VKC34_07940 [Blastocatellia bacterium]|nr:hypothetical protein [Blastocatellia bacterium]
MNPIGRDRHVTTKRLDEIEREVDELRRSINATRTHGILYYLLLVTIIFVGFAIGYATHSLVGAAIILIGLALIAWREVTGFRTKTAVLNHLLSEKIAERRQLEARHKEFEIER